MKFLEKIQSLPEQQRKIIFFVIMGVACVAMLVAAIFYTYYSVQNFNT